MGFQMSVMCIGQLAMRITPTTYISSLFDLCRRYCHLLLFQQSAFLQQSLHVGSLYSLEHLF